MNNRHLFNCLFVLPLFGLVLLFQGCAPRTYLIVDYQLPSATRQLEGRQVILKINDMREDRYIMSPAVARQFEGFKDIYSLALVKPDKTRVLIGEYDLRNLFRITFQKRLEALGVMVMPDNDPDAPVLHVDLQELKIDQKDRNWVAKMSYKATLSKDGRPLAKEMVKGSSERTKIIGRKGADNTVSAIFSDIINRLDIMNLFHQAKL